MKILLIDDHEIFRNGLEVTLWRLENVEIFHADSPHNALRSMKKIDVDLIIVDYEMPGSNGLDFLVKNKERSPEIPIILASAYNEKKMIKEALSHGASGFLPKSSSPKEILKAVKIVLDGGFYLPSALLKDISINENEENSTSLKIELANLARFAQRMVSEKNWTSSNFIRDHSQTSTQVLSIALKEIEKRQNKLTYYAFHDSLTGLPNHRLFMDRLNQSFYSYERNGVGFALISLDLDDFKIINDSYGHDVGDILLIDIAKRLSRVLRKVDTVARIGGDEFMILLSEEKGLDKIEKFVKRLQNELSKPLTLSACTIEPSASIGISLVEKQDTYESLKKKSDIALYHSKNLGKKGYSIYNNSLCENG